MLLKNKKKLSVLGNGKQKKSYIHVYDCINAMLKAIKNSRDKVNILNLGHNNYINVNKSIKIITKIMNCYPRLTYSGGAQGWVGDLPFVFLDNTRIKNIGWKPNWNIKDSICDTVNWLIHNQWIFNKRK
jgi:UDP-glucose 4-epimerase